jgi:hypothetical protein
MLGEVNRALEEYKAKYRRSDLPDLRLSGLYALFPDEAQTADAEWGWNDYWPHSDQAGVYFIFGGNGRLLYIGKASMNNCIGGRLSNYFGTDKATKRCRVEHEWRERPMYVATVAVPQGMKFEAPALEEYLIAALNPCDNVRGINERAPAPNSAEA